MLQDLILTATAAAPAAGGSSNNAEALQQMGFSHMIQNFDIVGYVVFVTLVIMSIGSWWYTVVNAINNGRVSSNADRVVETFWSIKNPREAKQFLEEQKPSEPFSKIALDSIEAASHQEGNALAQSLSKSEFVDRALRQAVTRESANMENGLTWLATVGATAPFVGLLGTVWGIYHALIRISASGSASIDVVAGPVGEALIMTAFGLFVAIPAVLAYNAFNRSNRNTYAKFDTFAHDLHDFFATGSRVGNK
jgi:biopolymer transport protein ExbB